ncbi:MAG TPA: tetratricopeptide repeat protein [Candidatus Limnocylindrales bacterium]
MPDVANQPPALRARGFGAAGSVAYWRGDPDATHRHYAAALEDARRSDDRAILAEALYNFAFATQIAPIRDPEAYKIGTSAVNEALELYHELGDQSGIAGASWALGTGALMLGDYDGARTNLTESLSAYRALGDPFGTGWALHELATVAVLEGDLDAGERMFREALDTLWATADLSAVVLILFAFTTIARQRGQLDRYWRLGGAARALQERTGTDLPAATASLFGIDWPSRPDADRAAVKSWDEGAALTVEDAVAYARAGAAPEPSHGPDPSPRT